MFSNSNIALLADKDKEADKNARKTMTRMETVIKTQKKVLRKIIQKSVIKQPQRIEQPWMAQALGYPWVKRQEWRYDMTPVAHPLSAYNWRQEMRSVSNICGAGMS